MRKSGFSLIELLIASVILAVLAAVAIPNFLRSEKRARESEVKTVAHALQMAVEDYKARQGYKPSTPSELLFVMTSFLPGTIGRKKNPFNLAETYGNSGIMFGAPGAIGRVGYIYVNQATPYYISALGGDYVIILTLVEGQ